MLLEKFFIVAIRWILGMSNPNSNNLGAHGGSPQMEFQDLTLLSLGMSHNPVTAKEGYQNMEKLIKLNPNVFPFNLPTFEDYQKMVSRLEQRGLVLQTQLKEREFIYLTEFGTGRFDILSMQVFS